MFNRPFIKYEIVVAPDANIIMYIPVVVATLGGAPKLINSGLKIIPPPSPKAPDIHPPIKEKIINFTKFLPPKSISPEVTPFPYFTLRSYSFFI